jgi:hypothetical protein
MAKVQSIKAINFVILTLAAYTQSFSHDSNPACWVQFHLRDQLSKPIRELFFHRVVWMLLIPLRNQILCRFPDIGLVQDPGRELCAVIQIPEHYRNRVEKKFQ